MQRILQRTSEAVPRACAALQQEDYLCNVNFVTFRHSHGSLTDGQVAGEHGAVNI